jgi:hypothetical protein
MLEREDNDLLDSIKGHDLSIYQLQKLPCAKAEIDIAQYYASRSDDFRPSSLELRRDVVYQL